jgi:peptidase M1-like protein
MQKLILFTLILASFQMVAQENTNQNPFRQLGQELPTPNVYRNAAGAPGYAYWQQKADYDMHVTLDDDNQTLTGKEQITYHNNSPESLSYLWIQLDQNMRAKDSDTYKIKQSSISDKSSARRLNMMVSEFDGGFKITSVTDENGIKLPYTINKTMMRIDLPTTLESGKSSTFNIEWWYNINNRMKGGGRSGYEYFEEEDNYLYTIAQFFPRMAMYTDVEGWQNKQFLGSGEFALTFGDYNVQITVLADHAVSATGTLQNPKTVLSKEQMKRLDEAANSFEQPVMIITPEEALEKESNHATETVTWEFQAENVRDFAFASSRKFIWDAMAVKQSSGNVMAMSMFPKEGNPLWEKYSTKVIAHTLKWYSHYTFDYPYPVAWSIHTNRIGMEYPMICFNGGRPEADGTYSERTKYGMISVIIHEVGHNYFPMIVNSDERQWTWMDEGLNTFLQFLTEQQWQRDYPSRRGAAFKITDYMGGDKSRISPIMTNSESLWQFGNNAYAKTATALNILRETIMGRELFDHAFKEYSKRWKFRHPSPADFFRTIEDASSVDLDWFWRGWFFTNDHVDLSLSDVQWFKADSKDPDKLTPVEKWILENPHGVTSERNRTEIEKTYDEIDPSIRDFYSDYDPEEHAPNHEDYLTKLSESERKIAEQGTNFYLLTFENKGGLVMPIILQLQYTDGTTEDIHIPAEIWKRSSEKVTKVIPTEKVIEKIILDPYLETADVDRSNNNYPPQPVLSRFELFKKRQHSRENLMQKAKGKS